MDNVFLDDWTKLIRRLYNGLNPLDAVIDNIGIQQANLQDLQTAQNLLLDFNTKSNYAL